MCPSDFPPRRRCRSFLWWEAGQVNPPGLEGDPGASDQCAGGCPAWEIAGAIIYPFPKYKSYVFFSFAPNGLYENNQD